MKVNIIKDARGRDIVQMDHVRFLWPNFSGRGDCKFSRDGERNFNIVIPDPEIAEALQNNLNKYGVGWNVKIKPPREEGEAPLTYLNVKVKFNEYGPKVHLISGDKRVMLTEETIGCLDNMDVLNADLDLRAYDGDGNYGPFRSAYLQCMEVTQNIDRFSARYADEEYPEE